MCIFLFVSAELEENIGRLFFIKSDPYHETFLFCFCLNGIDPYHETCLI